MLNRHNGGNMNDWKATGDRLGGISRSLVFQLWRPGELASVKVGKRRFSTDKQIAEYISRLEGAA
ncbi:hypothetical protein DKX15_20590 [Enterococcus faecium]|nr:hypothetical protein DKX15_20590 [Enterococcus faecium]